MLGSNSENARLGRRRTRRPAAFICLHLFALTWSSELICKDSLKKDLAKQQEKFNRQTGIVGKVKALIKISDIHLRSARHEINRSELTAADRDLDLYKESVERALEMLKSSQRNAQKNPAGFKEFEISLRKQLRVLDDLRSHYSFDQVQTINAVITTAKEAQDAMLEEIFGPENTRRRWEKESSRHPGQPKE